MRNLAYAVVATALLSVGLAADSAATHRAQTSAAAPPMAVSHGSDAAPDPQTALVKQYCVVCHNDKRKTGGLTLESFDASHAEARAETAEKMIHKLRAGMMPPVGAKRPQPDQIAALVTTLETRIDKAAATNPNPGWRPFQRLNRAEYARQIKDLLDLDVDVTAYLPPDTMSAGFDNVADVQTFAPSLMEGYLRAASQISRLAVGDLNATPTSVTYKLGRVMSQMRHVDGAPMGTRGGVSVVHAFPADGDYVFQVSLHYEPLGGLYGREAMVTLKDEEQIDVSIDGTRVALLALNPKMSETDPNNPLVLRTPPIHVKAGPQRVSAAFIQKLDGPVDDLLVPLENTLADVSISFGVTALPHMRDFTIVGPSKVTGISDTASRRRIFICRPTSADEEAPCAADIIKHLASQAYRDGTVSDDDFKDAMSFYEQGRKQGGFENGVRLALQSILVNPRFLLRLEEPVVVKAAAHTYRISDQDLASRLSFFLWGSEPDGELMKLAAANTLHTPAVLDKQVHRMLKDRRSEALSTRFAAQWLRLQDLDKIIPDYLQFPQYDESLANGMTRETELFFDSIVKEDRSVLDLLTADYSFVNERVAKHYGIEGVVGPAFRRVTLPPYRRGLLGQGSILTLTSVADRTSPVQRGKWIMEVLLDSPPPPPPPNVPLLDETGATADGKPLSVRQRMEEHRKNPFCASCHKVIDPLGLALDNFDATGAYRIKDNEVPVDAAGTLYDGTQVDGPEGLRDALVRHSDVFLTTFTKNLMTYALGRRVEYYDMPTIRQILRDAAKTDNRMSSFILGVVNSAAFRLTRPEPAVTTTNADAQPAGRPDRGSRR